MLINEIFSSTVKVILITMPRRWGKTMNLEMLKYFLEIILDEGGKEFEDKSETLNYKLFAGGTTQIQRGMGESTVTIHRSKLLERFPNSINYFGRFSVILLDFKSCKASSADEVIVRLRRKVTDTI